MAHIYDRTTGEMKPVKNLDWLLKHWNEVKEFEVSDADAKRFRDKFASSDDRILVDLPDPGQSLPDCWLVAYMKTDKVYLTTFADSSVLRDWLSRPRFIGLPLSWFGWDVEVGKVNHHG